MRLEIVSGFSTSEYGDRLWLDGVYVYLWRLFDVFDAEGWCVIAFFPLLLLPSFDVIWCFSRGWSSFIVCCACCEGYHSTYFGGVGVRLGSILLFFGQDGGICWTIRIAKILMSWVVFPVLLACGAELVRAPTCRNTSPQSPRNVKHTLPRMKRNFILRIRVCVCWLVIWQRWPSCYPVLSFWDNLSADETGLVLYRRPSVRNRDGVGWGCSCVTVGIVITHNAERTKIPWNMKFMRFELPVPH